MRIVFGFFIILCFIFSFIVSITGTMKQLNERVSVTDVLEQSVDIENLKVAETSFIKDQTGQIISEVYEGENRISLPFEKIPPIIVNAFIATEDQHFYTHKGFDLVGIARALFVNAQEDSIQQGASTITQQLVRNVYLSTEKSYNRKLSELLFAYQLENELSKEKILELYINTIYFHNQAYGIEAAANYYFSKPASALSLAETAFLCAIPNNPTLYDPLQHFDNTKKRQEWVLSKMLEGHFINQTQFDQAKGEQLHLNIKNRIDLSPNYVTYIFEELKQLIAEEKGFKQLLKNTTSSDERSKIETELQHTVEKVLKSGVVIETALQPKLQIDAENALIQTLPNNDIEGAVVVINNNTHEIVAIVGGKSYKKYDFHRAYQSYRQPGSSIKPLLVYSPYLAEFRSSPKSIINARPFCKNGYCPQNAGGGRYGNVAIETALKYSYNTAAVRMLDTLGIKKAFSYLNAFQFSRIVPEDYNLPAALGGLTNGVTPLEMTNAYTTFSNNGQFKQNHAIRKVLDYQGNVLFKWNDAPHQVWDVETNNKMREILHKVVTEGTGRKAYYSATSYIGGKTGTTNGDKDLWFIGLNDEYTTGVWVGKDTPSSLKKSLSSSPHLTIWKRIMEQSSNH